MALAVERLRLMKTLEYILDGTSGSESLEVML